MSWTKQIYIYCERGSDPAFWAEPVNALTNGAFLVAAGAAFVRLRRKQPHERSADHYLLVAIVAAIGTGSFLFHTFATKWAELADVAPIGIFMLVYMTIALSTFLKVVPGLSFIGTVAFAGLFYLAGTVKCGTAPLDVGLGGAGTPCLNGSVGYLPALFAMLIIGWVLRARRHPAGRLILTAGLVFIVSVTLRSIDKSACAMASVGNVRIGTHFAWHCLNGVTLYLLLRAAIDHWAYGTVQEILPPRAGTGRVRT